MSDRQELFPPENLESHVLNLIKSRHHLSRDIFADPCESGEEGRTFKWLMGEKIRLGKECQVRGKAMPNLEAAAQSPRCCC